MSVGVCIHCMSVPSVSAKLWSLVVASLVVYWLVWLFVLYVEFIDVNRSKTLPVASVADFRPAAYSKSAATYKQSAMLHHTLTAPTRFATLMFRDFVADVYHYWQSSRPMGGFTPLPGNSISPQAACWRRWGQQLQPTTNACQSVSCEQRQPATFEFIEMAVNFTRDRWKPSLTLKWDDQVEFLLCGASAPSSPHIGSTWLGSSR